MPKFPVLETSREINGIVASTVGDLQPIEIFIALGTVDNVGQAASTLLRQGLFLVKLTGGPDIGKYTHFVSAAANGQGDASTAVILDWDHQMETGAGAESKVACAYLVGTFGRQFLHIPTGVDMSKCQNIRLRDDMKNGY